MRQILIELHIPGQRIGNFFIVELPSPGEEGFYRQVCSYTWFHKRELDRAFPDATTNSKKNGMNWMQYARTIKYCSEHTTHRGIKDLLDMVDVDINTVPVCKGVWDFYDKIGYDKKQKKYF